MTGISWLRTISYSLIVVSFGSFMASTLTRMQQAWKLAQPKNPDRAYIDANFQQNEKINQDVDFQILYQEIPIGAALIKDPELTFLPGVKVLNHTPIPLEKLTLSEIAGTVLLYHLIGAPDVIVMERINTNGPEKRESYQYCWFNPLATLFATLDASNRGNKTEWNASITNHTALPLITTSKNGWYLENTMIELSPFKELGETKIEILPTDRPNRVTLRTNRDWEFIRGWCRFKMMGKEFAIKKCEERYKGLQTKVCILLKAISDEGSHLYKYGVIRDNVREIIAKDLIAVEYSV